jgi:hypothetical protein
MAILLPLAGEASVRTEGQFVTVSLSRASAPPPNVYR